MRINFVGEISIADATSKRPGIKTGTTKTGANYTSINLGVKAGNNTAFVECFGMEQKSIKTYDTDNKPIEISINDRNDADVIDSVANYRKHIITLNGERHVFIYDYDFVNFIAEHESEIRGKMFTVTGQTSLNEYNGTLSERFQIQNMYEADEDAKARLKVIGEFFFNKDSIDGADFKNDKSININGYIEEYVDKDHGKMYVPMTGIINAAKIDFSNEKHLNQLNFRLGILNINSVEDESSKITSKNKKSDYYKMMTEFNYLNGAKEVEFDESLLTKLQKEAIELGINTIDDFKPKGSTFGDRVIQYTISNFDLTNTFVDGAIKVDSSDDFEERIYVPAASVETSTDGFVKLEEDEEEDLDSLFD